MKKIKISKYTLIAFLLSILLTFAVWLCIVLKQQKKYYELQIEYIEKLNDEKQKLTEYETAYDFIEDYISVLEDYISVLEDNNEYNNELIKTLTKTILKLSEANTYTPEYIEQLLIDFENCNEIIINYYESGFHENNPDISLEDYIRLQNPELYERLEAVL